MCIVRNDFLPPKLNFYPPPAWGTPQFFSTSYPPSYLGKFQCLVTHKIDNFKADFFVVFVKNINFLIDCTGFYYQRNRQFKEGFDLLLTILYMIQNYIDHDDICSTPPAKILPPQLGLPPQHF